MGPASPAPFRRAGPGWLHWPTGPGDRAGGPISVVPGPAGRMTHRSSCSCAEPRSRAGCRRRPSPAATCSGCPRRRQACCCCLLQDAADRLCWPPAAFGSRPPAAATVDLRRRRQPTARGSCSRPPARLQLLPTAGQPSETALTCQSVLLSDPALLWPGDLPFPSGVPLPPSVKWFRGGFVLVCTGHNNLKLSLMTAPLDQSGCTLVYSALH